MSPAQWEAEIVRIGGLGVLALQLPHATFFALRESFGARIDPFRRDTPEEAEREVSEGERFLLAGVEVFTRCPGTGWPPPEPSYVVRGAP